MPYKDKSKYLAWRRKRNTEYVRQYRAGLKERQDRGDSVEETILPDLSGLGRLHDDHEDPSFDPDLNEDPCQGRSGRRPSQ